MRISVGLAGADAPDRNRGGKAGGEPGSLRKVASACASHGFDFNV